jgi:hypothetical protein
MAAGHELQQIAEELANVRRPYEMLQMKLANAAPQVDPEILFVKNAEVSVGTPEQIEAIVVERGGMDRLAAEQLAYAGAHFFGSIPRVGESQNFVRTSMSVMNQVLNAMRQDRSLTGSSTSYNQHGSTDVLDGFALLFVGKKYSGTGIRLRRRH